MAILASDFLLNFNASAATKNLNQTKEESYKKFVHLPQVVIVKVISPG
jgi:hypothetical protein